MLSDELITRKFYIQRWTSEGEFYIGDFVNSLSRLRLCVARFRFALYKKE